LGRIVKNMKSSRQPTFIKLQSCRIRLSRCGQTMVEMVAAIAVTAIVATCLVGLGVQTVRSAVIARNRTRAVAWAQEGIEAARSIRDRGYSSIGACGSSFRISWDGSRWVCASGTEDLGSGYTRGFTASDITSGERRVVCWVRWRDVAGNHEVSLETYLSNWR